MYLGKNQIVNVPKVRQVFVAEVSSFNPMDLIARNEKVYLQYWAQFLSLKNIKILLASHKKYPLIKAEVGARGTLYKYAQQHGLQLRVCHWIAHYGIPAVITLFQISYFTTGSTVSLTLFQKQRKRAVKLLIRAGIKKPTICRHVHKGGGCQPQSVNQKVEKVGVILF